MESVVLQIPDEPFLELGIAFTGQATPALENIPKNVSLGCFSRGIEYVQVRARIQFKSQSSQACEAYNAVFLSLDSTRTLRVRDFMTAQMEIYKKKHWEWVVEGCKNTAIVLFGDNLKDIPRNVMEPRSYTREFIAYLKEHNIGVVVDSPLIMNPVHSSMQYFCQAWMWIPPNMARLAVPLKEYIHNKKAMQPDKIHLFNRRGTEKQDTDLYKETTDNIEKTPIVGMFKPSNIKWGTLLKNNSQR